MNGYFLLVCLPFQKGSDLIRKNLEELNPPEKQIQILLIVKLMGNLEVAKSMKFTQQRGRTGWFMKYSTWKSTITINEASTDIRFLTVQTEHFFKN